MTMARSLATELPAQEQRMIRLRMVSGSLGDIEAAM